MLDWFNTDVATPNGFSAADKVDGLKGQVAHLESIFGDVVLMIVGSMPP
jgi:hypothetical protein